MLYPEHFYFSRMLDSLARRFHAGCGAFLALLVKSTHCRTGGYHLTTPSQNKNRPSGRFMFWWEWVDCNSHRNKLRRAPFTARWRACSEPNNLAIVWPNPYTTTQNINTHHLAGIYILVGVGGFEPPQA